MVQQFHRITPREAVVVIQFGPFLLDREARQLRQQDRELHVSPKAFDLLVRLAEARPRVLAKAELLQQLWPDTFVEEANLSNLIAEIRQALGDDARDPRVIRTVHRVGYAFCAPAAPAPDPHTDTSAPACWLEWGRKRFPLGPGEHVIGRDADAAVCLRGSTVSRHHARLLVTADGVVLCDCDSKNGTFRDGQRISSPVRLEDGDTIGIGSLLVTFHEPVNSGSTLTQARGLG